MSIVRIKDKRTGVTYVYDQDKGVYDPKTKTHRTHRVLIGKVAPETGETVPTRGWGKNRIKGPAGEELKDWRKVVNGLRAEVDQLRAECTKMRISIADLQEALKKK